MKLAEYSDTLQVYLEEIKKYKLLNPSEERRLFLELKYIRLELLKLEKASNQNCVIKYNQKLNKYKDQIVIANLRLVINIAKKYKNRGLCLEELICEGNIGLISAIDHFDVSKGYKFSTYATWWIKQAIIKALLSTTRNIKLPIYIYNDLKRMEITRNILIQKNHREPNLEELSHEMHLSKSKIEKILLVSLFGVIPDLKADDPYTTALKSNIKELVELEMKKLTLNEKKVVTLRCGLSQKGELTLKEVGDYLGLSKERIRQIQSSAFRKLKKTKLIKDF